jgi:hypothetical protein
MVDTATWDKGLVATFLVESWLGAAAVWLLLIACRSGVIADESGVLVLGAFTSRRVAWEDIDRFVFAPSLARASYGATIVQVQLRDGHRVPIPALTAATTTNRGHARRCLDALETMRDSRRKQEAAPSSTALETHAMRQARM